MTGLFFGGSGTAFRFAEALPSENVAVPGQLAWAVKVGILPAPLVHNDDLLAGHHVSHRVAHRGL